MSPPHVVLDGTYLMRLTKPDSWEELLSRECTDCGVNGLLELARKASMSAIGESTVRVSFYSESATHAMLTSHSGQVRQLTKEILACIGFRSLDVPYALDD